MHYKQERQRDEVLKVEKKIQDLPSFIQDYFVTLASSRTKNSNSGIIRKLLEWLVKQGIIEHEVNSITPDDLNNVQTVHIIKYLDGLKMGLYATTNSASSIVTKKNVISGFWEYLTDNDYVNKNIVKRIPKNKYKVLDTKVSVPTNEELDELLINLNNMSDQFCAIRNIAIVKLFKGSGLRLEELLGLDITDIEDSDMHDLAVYVMRKCDQDEVKRVKINRESYDALNDYIRLRNLNSDMKDLKPLFLSERKEDGVYRRISDSSIQAFVKKYSNGKIHAHMFRHYVGTAMYNDKQNLVDVQRQLGHKSINTSAKFYIQENTKSIRDSLEAI